MNIMDTFWKYYSRVKIQLTHKTPFQKLYTSNFYIKDLFLNIFLHKTWENISHCLGNILGFKQNKHQCCRMHFDDLSDINTGSGSSEEK